MKPVLSPVDGKELIIPNDTAGCDDYLPKDIAVLELIEKKIEAGERVIIYTAWTRLNTQKRLRKILTEKGIMTRVLDASIPAAKREKWVDQRVSEGVKVLIVNPSLVETGLDLNAFTTLIFYNLAFNLYVFRQASRRSWRINQTAPRIEVYLCYYANTMQSRALRLMASKLAAATVIEGNLSEEGLAALSDHHDMTTQLAKELMMGIQDNVEELSDTFKKMAIINHTDHQADNSSVKPPASSESLSVPAYNRRGRKKAIDNAEIGQTSLFDLLKAS